MKDLAGMLMSMPSKGTDRNPAPSEPDIGGESEGGDEQQLTLDHQNLLDLLKDGKTYCDGPDGKTCVTADYSGKTPEFHKAIQAFKDAHGATDQPTDSADDKSSDDADEGEMELDVDKDY